MLKENLERRKDKTLVKKGKKEQNLPDSFLISADLTAEHKESRKNGENKKKNFVQFYS